MNVKTAEFIIGVAKSGQLPRASRPEIAWAGRSNVGKSSLINRVISRKNLARTSNTPGKTRQINFYLINHAWHLVDLPGYGFARAPKSDREGWRTLIEPYLEKRPQLAGVALLVDARHGPTALDKMMFEWLSAVGCSWAAMLTKSDKISGNELAKVERQTQAALPQGVPLIPCSARTGSGIEAVRAWTTDRLAAHRDRNAGLLEWQTHAQGDE